MTTKLFTSVLCVLVLFVSVGTAIRCNYCSPSTSWASCYTKLRRVQCESRITSCITYFLKNKNNPNDVAYGVGCANTCNKNDVPDCRPEGRVNCEVNCCSYDYCNNIPSGSPSPAPSQGIKCYHCSSTTSWAACYASVKQVQCTSEVKSCLMASSKNKNNPNDMAFITGCAKTCDKNYISDCRSGGSRNCKFKCCSSDYCNHRSADLPTVGKATAQLTDMKLILVSTVGTLVIALTKMV